MQNDRKKSQFGHNVSLNAITVVLMQLQYRTNDRSVSAKNNLVGKENILTGPAFRHCNLMAQSLAASVMVPRVCLLIS